MKKIISAILSVLIILSVFSMNVIALDNDAEVDNTESVQEPEDFPEQPGDDKTDDTIVNLYLCSHKTDTFPHTWVYFENVSDQTVYVGPYELKAGEGVSSGSFGLSVNDGPGIYFNLETYRKTWLEESSALACIKTELNEAELKKVSKFIINHNVWNFTIFNCCYYAIGCWNAGGGSFIFPSLVFPSLARLVIKMHNSISDTSVITKDPDVSEVFRLKGFGNSAYLQVVKKETLDR